ncbi:Teichoic acid glycerol-phosphate transferase [archaeon HR05]|nr:Teichoic acid glycerol-phosphate transferase [archaeon HR05]
MILNFMLTILSYIIPKDRNLILLGSYNTFAGNTKTFYLYCLSKARNNFKIYWITHNKCIYRLLVNRQLPVLYIYTLDAFIHILRARYLLLTHGPIDISYFYFLFGKFNMIQTWHGIALKDITPTAEQKAPLYMRIINYFSRLTDRNYKLILATSEDTRRIFISAFNNENVKIIGYPRNDVFYNKELLYEDYREKLHLYNFSKVILYCPTFRENPTLQPFSNDFLNVLNEYLKFNNFIMLIKRHPYDNFLLNSINESHLSNIIDISAIVIDVQDLLPHVDILITDYSSILFDFPLLDRPIIFYPYDINLYTEKCRSLNYDYFEELPGPFATNEKELLEVIKRIDIIGMDDSYREKYKTFKRKFHYYDDGKACERLLDYLLKEL